MSQLEYSFRRIRQMEATVLGRYVGYEETIEDEMIGKFKNSLFSMFFSPSKCHEGQTNITGKDLSEHFKWESMVGRFYLRVLSKKTFLFHLS